jgi:putative spermidine/putrescine transport system ATP-binding protein
MSNQPAIRLSGLTKSFGNVTAVAGVNLDIAQGEFFSMLGPSGSGKTTVLRMIAGFETPTSGTVELFGKDVTKDAPFNRDVNTVFQDYALFPHMSVLENVAYGLRVRGANSATRTAAAKDALALVRLDGYGDRKPSQLSGGQCCCSTNHSAPSISNFANRCRSNLRRSSADSASRSSLSRTTRKKH